jgi:hypothetical protein
MGGQISALEHVRIIDQNSNMAELRNETIPKRRRI